MTWFTSCLARINRHVRDDQKYNKKTISAYFQHATVCRGTIRSTLFSADRWSTPRSNVGVARNQQARTADINWHGRSRLCIRHSLQIRAAPFAGLETPLPAIAFRVVAGQGAPKLLQASDRAMLAKLPLILSECNKFANSTSNSTGLMMIHTMPESICKKIM